jgi:3-hydroxyacyl-CoA dehydrogenase/enoyl-CoA hydratase/3-hydroxybutyryl-CoA epimerase
MEDPAVAETRIRQGQSIYGDVATFPVPTVAAIHGVCVGGGLEMALACDHRVLSDSPKTTLALPEVQLGILPGWGGTTRLPRLIGLQAALDLLLTGKKVDARKAKRIGLASEVVPAELFPDEVRRYALQAAAGEREPRSAKRSPMTRLLDDTPPGRRIVLSTARKKVMSSTGGHYPAPLRILDVLEEHAGGDVKSSLVAEAKAFASLVVSPVSKNLVHVFHMRQAARKGTGLARGATATPRPVASLGVLGAGVMGGGIAQLAAYRDVRVYMKDIAHEAVVGGLQHAGSLFEKSVRRKRMTRLEARRHMDLISGGVAYHGLSTADLVVEAIVEKLEIKKSVLAETERHVPSGCILATNTSSLSVGEMATALSRPEQFCGMHFFNPVDRMPLVEVIRGPETGDDSVATVYAFALALGKVPVVVGDGPGFLVNRILGPYLNEAGYLLEDGFTVEEIDRAATRFGMPMGPLRLIDEVGIDVSGHAGAALYAGLGERLRPAPVLVELGDTGRLGRKGGAGFYTYDKGKEQGIDPEVLSQLPSAKQGPADESDAGPDREQAVRRRLVLAMINEAARTLEDGIVSSAQDVDLAMIMGTGFPPFRGGLLRFADSIHPRGLLDLMEGLEREHGERYTPAPLLRELAAADRTFYDAYPKPGSGS